MKIYTKIFIGMAVGIVLGFTIGPTSALLDKDLLVFKDPGKLKLYQQPRGSALRIKLPSKVKADLKILEERRLGKELFYRVAMEVSERQALKGGRGHDGRPLKPGTVIEGWVAADARDARGSIVRVIPEATSSVGELFVAITYPVGRVFLKLIKMVIVPLVFASLLCGVASLGDIRRLGRLGAKTLGYFLLTTCLAISIGLALANVVNPGGYITGKDRQRLEQQFQADASAKTKKAAEQPSAVENLLNIVPDNPVQSMASGKMLQIIFFALFFGVALTLIPEEKSKEILVVMEAINDTMVMCVNLIMKLAPYGVMALVAKVVGHAGIGVLKALGVYSLVVLTGLAIHACAVYTSVVRVFGKISAADFWRAIRPAQLIAFSTSSSSATLPVTMECAENNLGVSHQSVSFVLPLGATVNMDGTALYQGVAAVFIAQVYGWDLTLMDQLTIVLTATMASIGAAGVPGVGMVTLAMVLTAICPPGQDPTVGVGLIMGVDRILDMFRTATNVTGDMSATVMVAATEGETLAYSPPSANKS